MPPQTEAIEILGLCAAKDSRLLKICCPNSLVGAKITA